jgi:hypothetical protein
MPGGFWNSPEGNLMLTVPRESRDTPKFAKFAPLRAYAGGHAKARTTWRGGSLHGIAIASAS